MTEPWTWRGTDAPAYTPQQFVRYGRLATALELSSNLDDLLDGLNPEPHEIAQLDQALAEADELEPGYGEMTLDQIIADAEAEAALQDGGAAPWARLEPHERE